MAYKCSTCGETHDGLPDIGFQWPDPYFDVPEDERESRVKSNSDICKIDDEYFYVRGLLLIPVNDYEQDFGLGIWVSQSQKSFETYVANYDTAEIGPFFGWLSNTMSFYAEDTIALQTMVHFQGNGQRPMIELGESDHPLYSDYSNGITLRRAWELVHTDQAGGGT